MSFIRLHNTLLFEFEGLNLTTTKNVVKFQF